MPGEPTETGPLQHVILAGGGHAHLAVLDDWARAPLRGAQAWLVTADPFTAYSGMIPGWMAGYYGAGQHLIDLRPLAKNAGVRLVIDTVEGLDANRRELTLSSGDAMSFDLLSLAVGGEVDISPLAGLGERLLPVRPMNDFVARWPLVLEDAARRQRFSLVVVGGGAAGIELALAAEFALRRVSPDPTVSIVTAENGLLSGHSPATIGRVRAELARRQIAVIFGEATGTEDAVLLSTGMAIHADYVIAATGSKAPRWLEGSGLALDPQGLIEVGGDLRSNSHDHIFAAGDIVTRTDRQVARSGVHAVHAGPVLAANLRASIDGQMLQQYIPRRRTLYLLATGDRRAILSWGKIALAGGLLWRLKDWIDRRFVRHHTIAAERVR